MELLCIQSQEHPELPLAELIAVMECENIDADIDAVTEGLVVLKNISKENIDAYYKILTKRLGYTHEVHELILKTDVASLDNDIVSADLLKICKTKKTELLFLTLFLRMLI